MIFKWRLVALSIKPVINSFQDDRCVIVIEARPLPDVTLLVILNIGPQLHSDPDLAPLRTVGQ